MKTPIIDCPSELTFENPIPPAELPLNLKPGFTIESTPAHFPYGKKVKVAVRARHTTDLLLECIIDITIKPDTEAPKLTCPQDIK